MKSIARIVMPMLMLSFVGAEPAATTQPRMTAIRMHEFGPPGVLKVETDVPRPVAGEGEILVRVHAAAVNPIDWKIRASRNPLMKLPYTPGFDVSGVVEDAGAKATKFKRGDEVFAMLDLRRGGGYAEYAVVGE